MKGWQVALFCTTAVLVVAVSGGVIFRKPLLADWTRFRQEHPVVASTVLLPKPRSATKVLDQAGATHGAAKPLDNGISGFSVLPGETHRSAPATGGVTPATDQTPAGPPAVQKRPDQAGNPLAAPAVVKPGSAGVVAAGFDAAKARKPATPPAPGVPAAAARSPALPAAHAPAPASSSSSALPAVTPAVAMVAHDPLVGPIPPKGTLQTIPHPIQAAAKLVAAPASRVDEIQTNSLVAALGRLVAELRSQNVAMQTQINALERHVDSRMTAFNQRLTFDQAHDALALAGASPPVPAPPASRGTVSALQSAQIFPVSRKPVAPVSPTAYRIQGASPGMAIVYRDGTPYQVSVGSIVPGVGRVISIDQDGSSWIVRTDHGVIR